MLSDSNSTNGEGTPLQQIGERIASNIAAITSFCNDNNYPIRSAQSSQSDSLLPPDAPAALKEKQIELLDLALELQYLATNPAQYIQRQAAQNHQFYCLRWIFHFRIPKFVPVEGPISYTDLAAEAGVPLGQLKSIARMAVLINFFHEPGPGMLAHNWNSISFARSDSLSELGRFLTDVSAPMATKMVEATEKWGDTNDISHTAYNIVNNTDLNIFKHIATVPELREEYATYMKNQAASEALSLRHLIDGFDWASLEDAAIVDVGGSLGHASAALASEFPELSFTIQDLPETIEKAKALSDATFPSSVLHRVTFEGHSFFDPQPQDRKSATFLLRNILHDWNDEDATKILRNLAEALKPKARNKYEPRIIIMDIVMPEAAGRMSRTQETPLRVRDLTMLQAHNAKERDIRDWYQLFEQADCGLVLRNVVRPLNSMLSVMEVAIKE